MLTNPAKLKNNEWQRQAQLADGSCTCADTIGKLRGLRLPLPPVTRTSGPRVHGVGLC